MVQLLKQIIHHKIEVPQINPVDSKSIWDVLWILRQLMYCEKAQMQPVKITL
jgi:hypothetical protein